MPDRYDVIGRELARRFQAPMTARSARSDFGGEVSPLRGPVKGVVVGPCRVVDLASRPLAVLAAVRPRNESAAADTRSP